jgi:ABC-type nickel/cobalt efflux system permease component RcnA
MDAWVLAGSAAGIAFLHTALGPDHYVPFAALGAARRWSTARTLAITALCGLGHVAASVALAFAAVSIGSLALNLAGITALRGDVAAWLLFGVGVAYAIYGLRRLARRQEHVHEHIHADGTWHSHGHGHAAEHLHPHDAAEPQSFAAVGWALFIVFLFGPCEPLIPLVMAPASQSAWGTVAAVILAFSVTTIGTMLAIVWALSRGAVRLARGSFASYAHSAAGVTVALCGVAMLLGL